MFSEVATKLAQRQVLRPDMNCSQLTYSAHRYETSKTLHNLGF